MRSHPGVADPYQFLIEIHPARQGDLRESASVRILPEGVDGDCLIEGQGPRKAAGFPAVGLSKLRTINITKTKPNFLALVRHVDRVAIDNRGYQSFVSLGAGGRREVPHGYGTDGQESYGQRP